MTKDEFAREMAALIAKKLSKPQREALLWLPEDGSERSIGRAPRLETSLYCLSSTIVFPGVTATLASRSSATGLRAEARWKATPFGKKVRAIVAAEV